MAVNLNEGIYLDEVQSNILDEYSSYTYNLTFSALPQSFYASGVLPIGYKNGAGRVIIAQTGVTTKFNIDDLQIETVTDNNGSTLTQQKSYSTTVAFRITEPQGSSLLTLFQVAYNKLRQIDEKNKHDYSLLYAPNETSGPLSLPYMLEVSLVGHRTWDADSDTAMIEALDFGTSSSSKYETIGNWVFPFYLTAFDFNPTTDGTEYMFQGATISQVQKKLVKETRMLSQDITIEGSTVNELFESLVERLDFLMQSSTAFASYKGELPKGKGYHKFKIQLGDKYDEKGKASQDWHSEVQSIMKTVSEETTPVNEELDKGQGEEGTGVKEETVTTKKMSFNKGRNIKDIILEILKQNHNFGTFITDQVMDSKGTVSETKKTNDAIWSPAILSSTVARAGETIPTGGPAFDVVFKVDLKYQAGVSNDKETQGNEKQDDKKNAVDKWAICKKYDYMFTGLNDQVLDVDISFPQGQIFLFPENGGLTPTYKDIKAGKRDKEMITYSSDRTKDRLLLNANAGALDMKVALEHFKQLGRDIKEAVTNLGKNTREVIKGFKEQADLAGGALGSLRGGVSPRLPSSPASLFTKSKSIAKGAQVVDGLFADVQDFQQALEDAAEDLAGGINIAAGQIAKIIAEAANPFDFTSVLSGKLNSLSSGIDGLVDQVSSATGLDLSTDDIPGLGEAQDLIDEIANFIETPAGFSGGSGWGNNYSFETLTISDPENKMNYLEEFDFLDLESEEWNFKGTRLGGEALGFGVDADGNKTYDLTQAQHYMTTALSYGKTGIPYLVAMELKVKGDPYWFGRTNYRDPDALSTAPSILEDKNGNLVFKEENSIDREDKSSAPYGSGSVLTAFKYVFPKEYDHFTDNFDKHTGQVNFTKLDPAFSGYYLVTKVIHTFSRGLFEQQLSCVKMVKEPNFVIAAKKPKKVDEEETA